MQLASGGANYADGSYVMLNGFGATPGPLTGSTLRSSTVTAYHGFDAGFTADFGAPVTDMPEPASLAMLVAGLAAVGRATLRRREGRA